MKKVIIAAICKNEQHNAKDWVKQLSNADAICVLDTGSTDNTVSILTHELGILGIPFFVAQEKFEAVDFAEFRNALLNHINKSFSDYDYVFYLDLDERVLPNWKEQLGDATSSKIAVHRFEKPDNHLTILERIFANNPGKWVYPLHECFWFDDENKNADITDYPNLQIFHFTEITQQKNELYSSIILDNLDKNPQHFLYFYLESIYSAKQYSKFLDAWEKFKFEIEDTIPFRFRHLLYRFAIVSNIKIRHEIKWDLVEKFLQIKNKSTLYFLSKCCSFCGDYENARRLFKDFENNADVTKYDWYFEEAYDAGKINVLRNKITN